MALSAMTAECDLFIYLLPGCFYLVFIILRLENTGIYGEMCQKLQDLTDTREGLVVTFEPNYLHVKKLRHEKELKSDEITDILL